MSNRKRYAKLALDLYSLFKLRLPKYEQCKANRLSNRRKVDFKTIICAKAKGSNAKYFGNRLRFKSNILTNKIKVNTGLKALSKAERKALFLGKQNVFSNNLNKF